VLIETLTLWQWQGFKIMIRYFEVMSYLSPGNSDYDVSVEFNPLNTKINRNYS